MSRQSALPIPSSSFFAKALPWVSRPRLPLLILLLLSACSSPSTTADPGVLYGRPYCGDLKCSSSEDCSTCPDDCDVCVPDCGDGVCGGDESCDLCPDDCGICDVTFYLATSSRTRIGDQGGTPADTKVADDVPHRLIEAGRRGQFALEQAYGIDGVIVSGVATLMVRATSTAGREEFSVEYRSGRKDSWRSAGVIPASATTFTDFEFPLDLAVSPNLATAVELRITDAGADADPDVLDVDFLAIRVARADPVCGDGTCDAGEDCVNCEGDCGACPPVCGDGTCDIGEDCVNCEADCGICPPTCGDGTCDVGEDCQNCAGDCGVCPPVCGDGTCDVGEDCVNCEGDCGVCGPVCGNNICEVGEDCLTCEGDCGVCGPVCDEPVNTSVSGKHNAGKSCLGCHNGRGAPLWTLAGTLYQSLDGGGAVTGATITVVDANGKEAKLTTAQNGNFWTTTNLAFPVSVRASSCPSLLNMVSPSGSGDCNSCHGSGFRVFLP